MTNAQMRRAVFRGMEMNAIVSFAVFVGLAASFRPGADPLRRQVGRRAVLFRFCRFFSLVEALQVFCYPVLLASGGVGKYVWLTSGPHWRVGGLPGRNSIRRQLPCAGTDRKQHCHCISFLVVPPPADWHESVKLLQTLPGAGAGLAFHGRNWFGS